MLSEIFKPIIKTLIIGLVILLFLLFNFDNNYAHNTFEIFVNNKKIYAAYYENYYRGIIPFLFGTVNNVKVTANDVEPVVNNLDLSDGFILDIKEYDVYLKITGKRSLNKRTWYMENTKDYDFKQRSLSETKLIIKRKNKILYEGKYIRDISKYIDESGRYFCQAIIIRKENFYTKITTHISFNFIVGGGNYEND